MSKTPQPAANSYTEKIEGAYSAVLIVEGTKLYVIYELLARYSEVFKKIFSGPWKESESKEVTLPGKSLQAVVWMLDYMYPQTGFRLTDTSSTALLPLAIEYQMKSLLELCSSHFTRLSVNSPKTNMGFGHSGIKHVPQLLMLTLAEKYDLKDLAETMLTKCAARLSIRDIDKQKMLPENKDLSDETYMKLIRRRLYMYENDAGTRKDFDETPYTVTKSIRWSSYLDDGQGEPKEIHVMSKRQLLKNKE